MRSESPLGKLFVIEARDKPASQRLRDANRPPHSAYLESERHRLVSAGSILDDQGQPTGSLLIVSADNLAEAEAFVANDPFTKAGLFASITVRPFRMAFKDSIRLR